MATTRRRLGSHRPPSARATPTRQWMCTPTRRQAFSHRYTAALSPHNFCFVSVADTELYHSSRLRCRAFTGLRQDCFHLKRSIWPS